MLARIPATAWWHQPSLHCRCFCSQGAKVEANFGRQPFQYDWTLLVAREQAAHEEALHRWGPRCCCESQAGEGLGSGVGPRRCSLKAGGGAGAWGGAVLSTGEPPTLHTLPCAQLAAHGWRLALTCVAPCPRHSRVPLCSSPSLLCATCPPQHERERGRGAPDGAQLPAALWICGHSRCL